MCAPGLSRPIVWKISKIETAEPIGVNKITMAQTEWNSDTDYVDEEEVAAGDIFAMYANYYSNYASTNPIIEPVSSNLNAEITATTPLIKVGGSYKLLTLKVTDSEGNDLTDDYKENITVDKWHCYVENQELTDLVTWSEQTDRRKIKLKFLSDRKYIGKTLVVKCNVTDDLTALISLDIGAL